MMKIEYELTALEEDALVKTASKNAPVDESGKKFTPDPEKYLLDRFRDVLGSYVREVAQDEIRAKVEAELKAKGLS